jgi:hypothetical protein
MNAINAITDSFLNKGQFNHKIIKTDKYKVHAELKLINFLSNKYRAVTSM